MFDIGLPQGHEYFIAIEPWNTNVRVIQQLTTRSEVEKVSNEYGGRVVQPGEIDELNAQISVNPEYINFIKHVKSIDEEKER